MSNHDHGIDFDAQDDIGYDWRVTTDQRKAYLQAMYRRMMTVRGRLFYDRGYGLGLWTLLLETELTQPQLEQLITTEALKDERTKRVIVGFVENEITITFIPHFSPHPLTLTIDTVTTEVVLNQG